MNLIFIRHGQSEWNKENKFWPYVSRIDNAFGDRNFFCVCPDIDSYQ